MRLPWVSRGELEAAEERARAAEREREEALDHEAIRISSADARMRFAEQKLAEIEAERRLLLDRIMEMSGQRPLYEKQGSGARDQGSGEEPDERVGESASQPGEAEPGRVTIPDLRAGFRAAVREKKVDVERCRARV